MVKRRLLSVLSVLAVALLVGASPAAADDGHHQGGRPNYPPKPPSISITKTQVMVGGTAVVHATGCEPGTTASVVVTVGTQVVFDAQVPVHGAGQVSTPIQFTTVGTNLVSVTCSAATGGTLTQSVTVTVVPKARVWADHDVVRENGHVDVSSSGHSRGSKATFDLVSSTGVVTFSATSTADADGVATAVLPLAAPGAFQVRVVDLASQTGDPAQTLPLTVLGNSRGGSADAVTLAVLAVLTLGLGGLVGLRLLPRARFAGPRVRSARHRAGGR